MGHIDIPSPLPNDFLSPRMLENLERKTYTPEEALTSILRITFLGQLACDELQEQEWKKNKPKGDEMDPTLAVMRVRALRSERDELRRRERVLREENIHLKCLEKSVLISSLF